LLLSQAVKPTSPIAPLSVCVASICALASILLAEIDVAREKTIGLNGHHQPKESHPRQMRNPFAASVFLCGKKRSNQILLLSNNLGEAATSFSDFVRGPAQI
jgi:hypothetical protein